MSDLAARVAAALSRAEGVVAVVLGGSRASGRADARSDVDLGIYYEPSLPLRIDELAAVASALQGTPVAIASPGEWGPWVNGGAWLAVEGTQVDLLFRDLSRVRTVFDECLSGVVTCDHSGGHPHGFHNHYYLAEVHHCAPLFDPALCVAALKRQLSPYPEHLARAIIEKSLYDAGFTLDVGRKSAPRGDVLHATGCLFRAAAALVQVLFALNAEFTMNEKRSLEATRDFARAPDGFATRIEAILAAPGGDAEALAASFAAIDAIVVEVHALAPPLRYSWPLRQAGPLR